MKKIYIHYLFIKTSMWGTNLIPNIDEYRSQYQENGGGENALAIITGCHWIEHIGFVGE